MEDLLEQEKREQERQAGQVTSAPSDMPSQDTNTGLLSDHDFERMRVDVMNTQGPQGLPAQGLLPLQHQAGSPQMSQQISGIRQKFLARGVNQPQWRQTTMTVPMHTQMGPTPQTIQGPNGMEGTMIRKEG